MKTITHTLLAFLLLTFSARTADTFTINGKEIIVPPPKGFVRVTDNMPELNKLLQKRVDSANDTLGFYIPESDIPAAMTGKVPLLTRTFSLKVNKEWRNITFGLSDFSQLKQTVKSDNQKTIDDIKSQIPGLVESIVKKMSPDPVVVDSFKAVPLEPHYETEHALAYSMYVGYGMTVGSKKAQGISVVTGTFLNISGVILNLCASAPQDQLEWERNTSKDWADSIIASNNQPSHSDPK